MNEQRVFCMKCKKDLTEVKDLEVCECGSKNFVYGKTLVVKDGKFSCECGSDKMSMSCHMNMNPKYITTYHCCECGESISTEEYYESPYY